MFKTEGAEVLRWNVWKKRLGLDTAGVACKKIGIVWLCDFVAFVKVSVFEALLLCLTNYFPFLEIDKQTLVDQNMGAQVNREIAIMLQMCHRNVCTMREVWLYHYRYAIFLLPHRFLSCLHLVKMCARGCQSHTNRTPKWLSVTVC